MRETHDRGLGVLIIGVNYAPEYTGIAPYTTALAEHLAKCGHRVDVLTGMPHYPAWKVQEGYAGKLTVVEDRNGVRVVRRALYLPSRQTALRRAGYEASFLLTGLASRSLRRPDAIVGVVPTLSGGVLARLMAARFRTRYGLLFQDLMAPAASQSGIAGGRRVASATRAAERWTVGRARAVAVVSPAFMPYLKSLGVPAHRLFHMPNWTVVAQPDPGVTAPTRERLGWRPDETIVLHAGNMGNKQYLEQVLVAAEQSGGGSEVSLGRAVRFVLLGDGSQRQALESQAAATGLQNLSFMAPEPDSTYTDVLAAADVLLVTERASVRDMALPSKLTSYAAAGRPVVAAVNPDGATGAEINRVGMGVVVPAEDSGALLRAVERLISEPRLAQSLGAAGSAYAQTALRADLALARGEELLERIVRGATNHPVGETTGEARVSGMNAKADAWRRR